LPGESRSRIDDFSDESSAYTAGVFRLGDRLIAVNRPAAEDDLEIATKDSLEKLLDANGKPYPRNYSSVWSTINHIRTIGEAMAMLRLDGLTAEPVLFGVRGLPDAAPLQLYLDQSFNDLHTNRGSGFRGPRSFFFEAQETLHATDPAAARGDRERIICELLAHPAKINEVILYEAADWLYKLPLDDADLCGHSFLDRCPSGEQ
jgi:hypothetical protein